MSSECHRHVCPSVCRNHGQLLTRLDGSSCKTRNVVKLPWQKPAPSQPATSFTKFCAVFPAHHYHIITRSILINWTHLPLGIPLSVLFACNKTVVCFIVCFSGQKVCRKLLSTSSPNIDRVSKNFSLAYSQLWKICLEVLGGLWLWRYAIYWGPF